MEGAGISTNGYMNEDGGAICLRTPKYMDEDDGAMCLNTISA